MFIYFILMNSITYIEIWECFLSEFSNKNRLLQYIMKTVVTRVQKEQILCSNCFFNSSS